ncbi:Tn3 family transposase [Streptomyces oryzae]|uniref:Tn3 family transposase n=1 Tax=Streptomyces oryzae TaxID=1434886 RepID=A0ABS3XJW5_9ACTN|nr:Tn3 family transposase [Streptomyces oryzae]MBO8195366.1 Tn3 family transposase [Streptomyces oryzae]
MHRTDKRGRRRVVRMVYDVVAFQALRDQLKCKEIWVVGADKWRSPDEDLPQDFAERREENHRELRNPLDAVTSVSGGGSLPAEVLAERLLLVIYAYGTNTGIKAVAYGGHGHTEDELRYVRRRYLSAEAARAIAIQALQAWGRWGGGRHFSSEPGSALMDAWWTSA